ncbi:MAG: hypothetical protein F9K21_06030 [Rhodocyclaceae bacterium]|nr:MAG: hypothetical protein F9K21_06030 [Rhodocyclaceae bacterium]MBE7424265.1 hypothetical protein [Zoogloeaceae bacterium]
MNGDKVAAEGLAQATQAMQGRVKAFSAAKNQRRHALTSHVFTSQTDNEARGSLYFQVFSISLSTRGIQLVAELSKRLVPCDYEDIHAWRGDRGPEMGAAACR